MMVFQQRGETIAGRNCFVDEGGEKDDGKGMKNTEQWCFSIGETDGKLLTIGVSATGKVAANGVAAEEGEERKAKQVLDGVVSGVRMMGEWDVSVTGKK
jgi:hypothetical protein